MKKSLLLPLFVIAVLASQGWAQPFCYWEANEYNNNTAYCGVVEGAAATKENCEDDYGTIVQSCDGHQDCSGSGGPFCYWEANEYNNNTAYCGVVEGAPATTANCSDDYGVIVRDCCSKTPTTPGNPQQPPSGNPQQPPSGNPQQPPSGNPQQPPGSSPIIKTLPGAFIGNALTAMQNAVNLQAAKGATLSIYDMKGNMLRSQKVEAGNHLVQLPLPRGLYVVQAASGSWKQTVKVAVK